MASKLVSIVILLTMLACHTQIEDLSKDARVIQLQEHGADFKMPSEIWDEITGATFEEAAEKNISLNYVASKVTLIEKNKDVLTDPVIQISLAKGGGTIDLSKYVTGRPGTFFVKFEFEGMEDHETFKSYFISNGKKRRLDNEIVGAGCNSYFNVSEFMSKKNPQEGLPVNTTRGRHVSVLAGHFIFSYQHAMQTYLSSVTFMDSANPELLCN